MMGEGVPHLVAHFMAAGAEQRLENFHFLRNTYETISAQEIQLNRILRMLGEDEFALDWKAGHLAIGRARARSLYEFDRFGDTLVLPGSIAYERLRELENTDPKNARQDSPSASRLQHLRERRSRLSEQRDYSPTVAGGGGSGASGTPSASRLRALAEYDEEQAASEAKRRRRAEENRSNAFADDDSSNKGISERRRDRLNEKNKIINGIDEDDKPRGQKFDQQDEKTIRRAEVETDSRANRENNFNKTINGIDEDDKRKSQKYDQQDEKTVRRAEENDFNKTMNDIDDDDDEKRRNQNYDEEDEKTARRNDTGIDGRADQEDDYNKKNQDRFSRTTNDLSASTEPDDDISAEVELNAFHVRCETLPAPGTDQSGKDSRLRLSCDWAQPTSSSAIDHYTIERQFADKEWLPIGDQIDKSQSQTQFDLSPSSFSSPNKDKTVPTRFRLVARTKQGQTFASEPTDEIMIVLPQDNRVIIPDVQVLSDNSVQLTWTKDEDEATATSAAATTATPTAPATAGATPAAGATTKTATSATPTAAAAAGTSPTTAATAGATPAGAAATPTAVTAGATPAAASSSIEIYDIEKKEQEQNEWEKVTEVPVSQGTAQVDGLADARRTQFRLVPSTSQQSVSAEDEGEGEGKTKDEGKDEDEGEGDGKDEGEGEVLTVHNVNEWLSSLRLVPSSANTVDVDISEDGFKEFDRYKVEYTTVDRLDGEWTKMPEITRDDPHLTINNLKQATDYKFRFTPILDSAVSSSENNASQVSLVLDVKMPSTRKARFAQDESTTPIAPPPEFAIHQLSPTSVVIEAVGPSEKVAAFEDVFDVYSKKDAPTENDDPWTKVGTIDKDHLSTTVDDLEENTAYAFKIDNITSPSSSDEPSSTVQQFKFDTTPVKQFDSSHLLEKFEQSLENVVGGVMRAAAGHQVLEEPVNLSLNEVIKEVFREENLLTNEQYGFDTLALSHDLQLFRGPKQLMLQELEINETSDTSKRYGEIIIHNNRTNRRPSITVREENGNTRVGNIDGDIIIRNVVSDVLLTNDETRNRLSMNIVGQAFLKGVQGTLTASKFRGIIVVKNVNKP